MYKIKIKFDESKHIECEKCNGGYSPKCDECNERIQVENMDKKAYQELRDDEVECSNCNGSGAEGKIEPHIKLYYICVYCNGNGKVDWVRGITKTKNFHIWSTPVGGFKRGLIASIQGSNTKGKTIWGQKTLTKSRK